MANIFLIGFMGTGKTTISEELKRKYDMTIMDMDSEIEKSQKMSIPDIFKNKGEEFFRDLESGLIESLKNQNNLVVSCGGGAVLRDENISGMKESGKIVLLKASPETIFERVRYSHNRPLLEGNKNVDYIRELMGKREDRYNMAADYVVEVDDKSVPKIADEIYNKVFNK